MKNITEPFGEIIRLETTQFIKTVISDFNLTLPFSSDLLEDLILMCTESVQFQFQEKLYTQLDGVAMGSPLGPVLADIFLGYLENYRLKELIDEKTVAYFRFVDDIFCVLPDSVASDDILNCLNSTHPSLSFTSEVESDRCLPFLDVKVSRDSSNLVLTSIFRKPTWSGLYTHFFSFVSISYKRGLVRSLFHRARKLCSPSLLQHEVDSH